MALLPSFGLSLQAQELAPAVSSTGTLEAPPIVEPYLWPIARKVNNKKVAIVSGFGQREVPESTLMELHEGVDFAVPPDTAVHASRPGKVLFAGFSTAYVSRVDKKDKSRLLIIRHGDGSSTRYVHLDRLRVTPGQQVVAGQVVGSTGDSDEWTQPVLHFEIRDPVGKALDPGTLLQDPSLKVTMP